MTLSIVGAVTSDDWASVPIRRWRAAPARGWRSLGSTSVPLACLLLAFGLGGCGRNADLETAYGTRRGNGVDSVNGTSVLATMFELRDFRVYSWNRLSPKLQRFDVIVWTPNCFSVPSKQETGYLERWLRAGPDRTLVYVGRDYDAATHYWESLEDRAEAAMQGEVRRRWALARARHAARRLELPVHGQCRWFTVDQQAAYRHIKTVTGPWADALELTAVDLRLQAAPRVLTDQQLRQQWQGRSIPERNYPHTEVLMGTDADPLVTRVTQEAWNGGQLLIVANGSWLLNYPLVNRSHRQLADQLIQECGTPRRVAFLESDADGLPIYQREPEASGPQFKRERVFMTVHWLVLGLAICFAMYPIFGRARDPGRGAAPSFGHHIEAYGDLLKQTGDAAFARRQVGHYRSILHGDRQPGKNRPAPDQDVRPTDATAAHVQPDGSKH